MVILLSALAVVVAAVLLVTWIVVQGGFALIYASMAFAVLSMVLLWAARWIGSSPAPATAAGPEPLPELDAPLDDGADEASEATEASSEAVERPPRRPRPAAPVVPVGFPIAEYDTLWVSQIVPLLPELDRDELAVVEARERGGRHRAAVLDAIAATRLRAHAVDEPVPAEPIAEEPIAEGPIPEEPAVDVVAVEQPVVEPWADESPVGEAEPADGDGDWLHDDRGPLDWPAVVAEGVDAWDAPEPDEWDWSAIRGEAPAPDDAAPDDGSERGSAAIETELEAVDEVRVEARDELDDLDEVDLDDVVPNEAATVRMFLGRRRSTVTVRRT